MIADFSRNNFREAKGLDNKLEVTQDGFRLDYQRGG